MLADLKKIKLKSKMRFEKYIIIHKFYMHKVEYTCKCTFCGVSSVRWLGERVQHRRPLLYQIWEEHGYIKPVFQTNISEILNKIYTILYFRK